jgi:hypothetical protein
MLSIISEVGEYLLIFPPQFLLPTDFHRLADASLEVSKR